ncbi:MAG: D-tagatose-bisphosphate aldolase, class II, non-catalytic subunit [Acidobacteriaceae bacterium]|nr:D-tagatose-bisphosphate aldolase, class II, non-catalytic subunit [Acidobacteriaceae bacterium]
MPELLERLVQTYTSGQPAALYSVCSAHPLVVKAALQQAKSDGSPLLVEATSNQVNQFGGYTGMRPADFRDFVFDLSREQDFPLDQILLGGDHLGPNPWQNLPAEEAMPLAEAMVEEYSRAGFVKIHLDASMPCAGEPHVLPGEIIAERAARLCQAAERGAEGAPRFYIIGTEVPVPGGATESLSELEVTKRTDALETLAIHHRMFEAAGLAHVWPRVVGLVVQPGVEFNHDSVVEYRPEKTAELQTVLQAEPHMVFEAHSTDYQKASAYKLLAQDGFVLQKVGPALTFAMREALFALEGIEKELIPESRCSHLAQVMEAEMLATPKEWSKHYHGDELQQKVLRRYSYSDRLRYYWKHPAVDAAYKTLMENLSTVSIPETLLSAFLPSQYLAVRLGELCMKPEAIVLHKIREALLPYTHAGILRMKPTA